MQKLFRKILAFLLVGLFLSTQLSFESVFADFTAPYSFETAEAFPYMSTEFSAFALAEDGTLIRRTNFAGNVKDVIVRFFGNSTVLIPLEGDMIQELTTSPLLSKALSLLLSSVSFKAKLLLQLSLVVILLFACSWMAQLNDKRKSLLSVINRSRAGGYNTYCFTLPIH